jgi:hypothetical protein
VKSDVGSAAVTCIVGTAAGGAAPTSSVIVPASLTDFSSTRWIGLPIRVVKASFAGSSDRWWMYSRRPVFVDESSTPSWRNGFERIRKSFVAVVADCCVRARSSAAAAAGVLGGVLFDFFIAVRIARRCATTREGSTNSLGPPRPRLADLRGEYCIQVHTARRGLPALCKGVPALQSCH